MTDRKNILVILVIAAVVEKYVENTDILCIGNLFQDKPNVEK